MKAMKEILRRTWAEIDLDALAADFQAVRACAGEGADAGPSLLKQAAKGPDGRYAYGRTLVCLHVMGDRGLLAVERERVCLRRPERKVDLEQAGLMRQLRMFINGA